MRALLIVITLVVAAPLARAETPPVATKAPAPAAPPVATRRPVQVGPTTVTVIDEKDSVDDIISRVRRAQQSKETKAARTAVPVPMAIPAAADGKDQPRVRDDGEQRPRRERLRERVKRLREPLRDQVTRERRLRAVRAD
jgi:hypothetical protein